MTDSQPDMQSPTASTDAAPCRATAVCVLGMHRSGTSAVARLLNLLGVDLGEGLIPASDDNPRGFWEDRAILDIHEDLLDKLGSSFDDFLPLPDHWHQLPEVEPYRKRLIEVLRGQFGNDGLWGFKDPRTCRLLPLWLEIFNSVNADPKFVIVIRNPEEIVRSLAARDGYSFNKSVLLTLTHLLQAERATRGLPRVIVSFDSVLRDWRGAAKKISDQLDIRWPRQADEIAEQVLEFLDPGLRHHAVTESLSSSPAALHADANAVRWMDQLHQMFINAEDDAAGMDSGLVDRLFEEVAADLPRLQQWRPSKSIGRKLIIMERWGQNLNEAWKELRQENNWLKLALAQLKLEPGPVLDVIKAQAEAFSDGAADVPTLTPGAEINQAQLMVHDVHIGALQQEVQRLTEDNQEAAKRLSWLNEHVPELQKHIAQLTGACEWLGIENQAMRQMVEIRDSKIAELNQWTTELDQTKQWLANEHRLVKQEIAAREQHNQAMQKWVAELEASKQWLSQELAQRDQRISELQDWTRKMDTDLQWLAADRNRLEAELASVKAWAGELHTGNAWLAGEQRRLTDDHARLLKWTAELESGNCWVEAERKRLAEQLANAGFNGHENAGAQAPLNERETDMARLESWAMQLEQDRQWLAGQFAGAKVEIANRDTELQNLRQWVTELETAKAWLAAEQQKLAEEVSRRDELIKQLQSGHS